MCIGCVQAISGFASGSVAVFALLQLLIRFWRFFTRERPNQPDHDDCQERRDNPQWVLEIHNPVANVTWCEDNFTNYLALGHVPRINSGVGIALGCGQPRSTNRYQAVRDGEVVFGERYDFAYLVVTFLYQDRTARGNRRGHRARVDHVHLVRRTIDLEEEN